MNGKMWLYSGLLVLIMVLLGVGIWLVLSPKDTIKIPESDPVVVMDISFLEEEKQSQLFIYEDGTVIHWEDTGLQNVAGDAFARTWRTGTISAGDIEFLFDYLESVDFNDLEEIYLAPDVSASESITINDMYCTISADNGDIDNSVTAYGYFVTGTSNPYSELPYPIKFIYEELKDIIDNNTEEALVEELTY
jgi:hypothetical protein